MAVAPYSSASNMVAARPRSQVQPEAVVVAVAKCNFTSAARLRAPALRKRKKPRQA